MRNMPTKLSDCHADTFSMCSQSCVNAGLFKDSHINRHPFLHPYTHTYTDTLIHILNNLIFMLMASIKEGNATFRLEPQTIRPKADPDILTGVVTAVCVCVGVCDGVSVCVWALLKPLSRVCLKCLLHSMCSNFIWALADPSLFIYDSQQQQLPNILTPKENRQQ